mgnify:CR=1 FL=1
MTTIILDARTGEYAADGLVVSGDTKISECKKKVLHIDDKVYGVCGETACSDFLFKELKNGATELDAVKNLLEIYKNAEFEMIWMQKGNENRLFSVRESCIIQETSELYEATGTGREFALASLDCGASIEDAIKTACKRDLTSGGEIVNGKL